MIRSFLGLMATGALAAMIRDERQASQVCDHTMQKPDEPAPPAHVDDPLALPGPKEIA